MSALIIIRDAGEATSLHLVKPRCSVCISDFSRERERERENEKPKEPCQTNHFWVFFWGVQGGICPKNFPDAPPPSLI
jgi:hypothetical protein